MKKQLALLAMLTLGSATVANAIPFSETIDFNDTTFTANGVEKTGTWLTDTGNPQSSTPGDPGYVFAYSYTHNVSFAPEAASVNNAYLDITFSANQASTAEAWFVYEQEYLDDTQNTVTTTSYHWLDIFHLFPISTDTEVYTWATQTLDLSNLIAGVSGSSWTVAFSVDEHTPDTNETMFLAESTLRGDYNPVPEPTTMLLMGFGLAGLVGYNRKRSSKKA